MTQSEYIITHTLPWSWDVYNETKDVLYRVDKQERNKRFLCNCPHWYYRLRLSGGQCKHIQMVVENGGWDDGKY